MVKRTNNDVLVRKRRGQSCRGFCTLEIYPANLGAGESICADLQKVEKVCFWEGIPPAGTSKFPSCKSSQKEGNTAQPLVSHFNSY